MKKKILFTATLCLLFVVGFSQTAISQEKSTYTVSGEIKGLSSNLLVLIPSEYSGGYVFDTIFVKNNKFTFTHDIDEVKLVKLFTRDQKLAKRTASGGYYPVKSQSILFFAFPGADVKITGEATDFFNAYPSGDAYNNSMAAINKIAYPNFNKSVNLSVKASFEKDTIKAKELAKLSNKIKDEGKEARIKHLEENPSSLGALWYLNDMMRRKQIDNSKSIELFNNIPKDFSDLSFYKNVELRINGISATKEGMPVPSIKTTATLDGAEFNITSLRGKYVLIDFWGTWCGPCVKEMPKVKEFQEKYKENLVVLGINSGDRKERIQQYVDKKGYTWQQLMSVKGDNADDFVNQFNVRGFPTKFIIDPEGNIIKKFVGSGDEAFHLLDKLLN